MVDIQISVFEVEIVISFILINDYSFFFLKYFGVEILYVMRWVFSTILYILIFKNFEFSFLKESCSME